MWSEVEPAKLLMLPATYFPWQAALLAYKREQARTKNEKKKDRTRTEKKEIHAYIYKFLELIKLHYVYNIHVSRSIWLLIF